MGDDSEHLSINYLCALALLTLTIIGEFPGVGSIINPQDAFSGFGHPAVVTVVAVLVVGRGLLNSGLVQFIVRGQR